MSPGKAEAVWRVLVREAGLAEIERAANVSVADAERELAMAGFDVDGERRAADARIRSEVERAPAKSPQKAMAVRRDRSRWELWLAVASFAALLACAVVAAFR